MAHLHVSHLHVSQGDRHVWYVGAYVVPDAIPLLESGVASAISVASALGADVAPIAHTPRGSRRGMSFPTFARWFAIAMVVVAMVCHVEALWVLAHALDGAGARS